MKTGQINVQTENIFPIIKKFLYSDHEIFLRELVSNAVDASQKLKFFASNGEFKGELGDLKVEVILNKEEKTLIMDAIIRETGAIKIQSIGHVLVLFKQSDEKKIELPKR